MKKLIASSVLVTATLFPTFAQAEGLQSPASMLVEQKVEVGKEAAITADNVNVRKGATTSYAVVTKLSKGKVVKVVDSFTNSIGELWYRIDTGAVQGWVIQDYLEPYDSKPAPPVTEVKTVQVDNTPVRKGATSTYAIVTYVNKGQKVTTIDKFTNAQGEVWYRADLGSIKGWIHEDAFDSTVYPPSPPETSLPEIGSYVYSKQNGVDVRKGATTSYPSVSKLSLDQKVKVIDHFIHANGTAWLRIEVNSSLMGWIPADMVNTYPNLPSPPETSLPANGSFVYSLQNGVDVRKGATASYPSVSKLSLNQKVKVVDHFIPTNGAAWLRVEVNSSLMGWIPADTVSSSQSINIDLYVSATVANLRSGPSLNHPVIDQATKGTVLKATKTENSSDGALWYQVLTSSNNTAWVHESVVSKQPAYAIGSKYIVGKSNINLRSGASTSYKVKEVLKINSVVTVLGEFTNSLGQNWIQLKSAAGNSGWIQSSDMASFHLVSKELLSPTVTTVNGENFLNWTKASKFPISYTTLSSNRLKLTGGFTDIQLPTGSIKGIESIETFASGNEKSLVITFKPGYSFTFRDYDDKLSIKIVPFGLLGKKVIIDAGHGGKDTGTIGPTGLREKDVNLATALLLKAELEKNGAIVTLTRSTDIFLELSERTDIANNSTADAFISIHGDSFSSTSNGTTTYYNSTVNYNGPRSKTLGDSVQKKMVDSMGTYNRGVKEQNFYVNRLNQLPSVLVELAFLSNPKEEALLKTEEFRKKAAIGITNGLNEYFNKF